jgi:hypothetical protein
MPVSAPDVGVAARNTSRAIESEPIVRWHWWEPVLVFAIGLSLLWALIVFYDNVHRGTTNGLWKSIQMVPYFNHLPERMPDPGNLLYFPVLGRLLHFLPESMFGPVWRRMAFFNAACGAAVLALEYLIACRLFRSRSTAVFACVAQACMAFFLLLSTINEDIMPGYFWFVGALAVAVVPRRLTLPLVILSAQCIALSWLFHSSLQLPGIGALIVGLGLSAESMRTAITRVLVFCVALMPVPILSALKFQLPWTAGVWAGKGVDSGWGGFAANKIIFFWSGVAQSVFGGENVSSLDYVFARANVMLSIAVWLLLATACIVWLRTTWRERDAPEWRLATGILATVFLLGEAMNLYIQPQDPQMQIQPMTWAPFAVACIYWRAPRMSSRARWIRGGLVAAAFVLAAVNVNHYVPQRHLDSIAQANVRAVTVIAGRERTVFLLHGFEPMNTWLTAEWGPGTDQPVHGSREIGRYNAISVIDQATMYPDRTPDESAGNVVELVAHALDEGFDVVSDEEIWNTSEEGWVSSFATVSSPEKPLAIRRALLEAFTATRIGSVAGWTTLYKVTRKDAPTAGARIAA